MNLKRRSENREERAGFRGARCVLAFTLVEVLIAVAIFFMAMFAILGVLSQSLRAARSLQHQGPTPSLVAADICLTNRLEESSESGNFGDAYPGYRWTRDVSFYASNGLWRIDIFITHGPDLDSAVSFLRYTPESGGSVSRLGGDRRFIR